jgi:hypothetical protein
MTLKVGLERQGDICQIKMKTIHFMRKNVNIDAVRPGSYNRKID